MYNDSGGGGGRGQSTLVYTDWGSIYTGVYNDWGPSTLVYNDWGSTYTGV